MWYVEVRSHDRWWPQVWRDKPETKDGRIHRLSGPGPVYRGLQEVPQDLRHRDLFQLQAVLSPDGHLKATQPKSAPEVEDDGFITVYASGDG